MSESGDSPFYTKWRLMAPGAWISLFRDAVALDLDNGGRVLALAGIAAAAALALLSASYLKGIAPLVQEIAVDPQIDIVTGLHWFEKSDGLAIGWSRLQAIAVTSDGGVDPTRAPLRLVAERFALVHGREDLRPAVAALSGLPGKNGEFETRVQPGEVLTPGRLVAIDKNGYLLAPGTSLFRASADVSAQRFAPGQEAGSVWQIGQRQSKEVRALRVAGNGAAVSAIAFMPHANLVAVGALDGGLRLVGPLQPTIVTGYESPADDLVTAASSGHVAAHDQPVIAIAAADAPALSIDGFDLVSLASDHSLKAWRLASGSVLEGPNLAFADAPPDAFFVPDGLQISSRGETIAMRAPNGAIYVARIVDDDLRSSQQSPRIKTSLRTEPGIDPNSVVHAHPDMYRGAGWAGGGTAQRTLQRALEEQRAGVSRASATSKQRSAANYHVQVVVRNDDHLDISARQAEFDRMRAAVELSQGSETIFDSTVWQRGLDAIKKNEELAVFSQRTVEDRVAEELRNIKSPYLSLLPSPILLRDAGLSVAGTAAVLSSNGRRLFVAGTDCQIREIDLDPIFLRGEQAKVIATMSGHGGLVTHLALSPNGEFLAASSLDGRVRIHQLAAVRRIAAIPFADLGTGPACSQTAPIALNISLPNR